MKKNIVAIYGFAVCVVTMIVIVASASLFLYGVASMIKPDTMMSNYEYNCHQDNVSYQDCLQNQHSYNYVTKSYEPSKKYTNYIALSQQEQTKKRKQSYQQKIQSEIRDGIQQMIYAGIVLLVSGIVFIIHVRIGHQDNT